MAIRPVIQSKEIVSVILGGGAGSRTGERHVGPAAEFARAERELQDPLRKRAAAGAATGSRSVR